MWRRAAFGIILLAFAGQSGLAQNQQLPEADPGVRPTRLIDRAEVRVSRIEMQGGAVRRVHQHDDVEYHLWIPIEGRFELTMGSEAPVAATNGQAFFMKKGTPHGFKNLGTTPGAVFEIFVKQTTTAGGLDLAPMLAALTGPTRE